jgi:hypothetical protein
MFQAKSRILKQLWVEPERFLAYLGFFGTGPVRSRPFFKSEWPSNLAVVTVTEIVKWAPPPPSTRATIA